MSWVEWLRCSRVQTANGRSPTAGRPTANVASCCIGSVGTASGGGGRNNVLLWVTTLGLVRLDRNQWVLWTGMGNATGTGPVVVPRKEVVVGWGHRALERIGTRVTMLLGSQQ